MLMMVVGMIGEVRAAWRMKMGRVFIVGRLHQGLV